MDVLPKALGALADYAQFIIWKAVPREGGKVDKLPVDHRTLQVFTSGAGWQQDPQAWTTSDAAIAVCSMMGPKYGVGFFFTPSDPFYFLDIDKCHDGAKWSDIATALCSRMGGAAVEVSQSGRGLHIFGTGAVPDHGCKNIPLGLELYTSGRFVALTGKGARGDASTDCTPALATLVAEYFPRGITVEPAEWSDGPVPEWNGPTKDDELIALMLRPGKISVGATMEGRATLIDLWAANEDALGVSYPDPSGDRAWDGNGADMALCCHLAFYTGKDCERIERLFSESGLVRDKWTERDDYRHRTVSAAVSMCKAVYGDRSNITPVEPAAPIQSAPTAEVLSPGELVAMREGYQYLGLSQQVDHFAGCVYVQDIHKAFTPEGQKLKAEQFKTTYGGYVFGLDSEGKATTKNAWEAFTESQGVHFPKVHTLRFRPELPAGAIVDEEGLRGVNSYVPIPIRCMPGDVSPFLDHIAKLLPDRRDRDILLAYMAGVAQNLGAKFQYAILMQGMEGNGKTILANCLTESVGRRYTHIQAAQDLGNQFNAWVQGHVLVVVEEVHVSDRREMLDALKPLITNERVGVQGKGADQGTGDNCANFFMFSNHKDAILKTRTDRRFCVFYTAQQELADMRACGMNDSYFNGPNGLVTWLKGDGYAKVTNYLREYAIPDELNPCMLGRAPDTSSTAEVLALSIGGVEQEILEAVAEGRPGFSNGWISSMAFDRFLQNTRNDKKVPQNKRKAVLRSLGYELHPGLKDGRVNSVVSLDAGKPRLYIRSDIPAANLTKNKEIIAAYEAAQQPTTPGSDVSEIMQT